MEFNGKTVTAFGEFSVVDGVFVNGSSPLKVGGVVVADGGKETVENNGETKECEKLLLCSNSDGVRIGGLFDGKDPSDVANVGQVDSVVERLCPAFSQSGSVVTCEPVQGHPLQVVSNLAESETGYTKAMLHRCGKNLLNLANRTAVTYNAWETTTKRSFNGKKAFIGITTENNFLGTNVTSYTLTETGATFTAKQSGYCIGFDIPVVAGMWYQAACAEGYSFGINFYAKDGTFLEAKTGDPVSVKAPANAAWALIMLPPVKANEEISFTNIRAWVSPVWVGSVTEFEQYKGDYFTADFGKTVYGGKFDWKTGVLTDENGEMTQLEPQQIRGISGVNTVYSNTGETEVTGRTDLVAYMEKMRNAILSLGGNV